MTGATLRPHDALPVLPWTSALALVGVLLAAVMLPGLSQGTLWRRVLQDAGHGPVFAGIAIVLLLWRAPLPGATVRSAAQYRDAFLLALALGVLTELVQVWMPDRHVSLLDVLHDAAGAVLGLCLAWWLERRSCAEDRAAQRSQAVAPWVLLTATSALALLAWQPLQVARAYAVRHAAFPTLLPLSPVADASFARARHAVLGHGPLPPRYRRAGDVDSIRLIFSADARPGLQLFEPSPDWRAHGVLAVDLTNPGARPVPFSIRVLDATHDWSHGDRFNQPFEIPAGSRVTLRFSLAAIAAAPQGRLMDMAAVADLMLFARQPLAPGEIYITRIWLE